MDALYRASLCGDGQAMEPACELALAANFGSVEHWRASFAALARSSDARSGWMLLAFLPLTGTMANRWSDDPTQAFDDGVPILAFDVRDDVDAFLAGIHWPAVYARYQAAVHAASEPWGATQDDLRDALLLDVRRAGVYEKAMHTIPGARWRDPATVERWSHELRADRPVVVYCVYGHEVGRATALRLRAAGVNARYLLGGIDAWQAAGRPLADKPQD
jgi:Fe-Mn family superoxide dismutase